MATPVSNSSGCEHGILDRFRPHRRGPQRVIAFDALAGGGGSQPTRLRLDYLADARRLMNVRRHLSGCYRAFWMGKRRWTELLALTTRAIILFVTGNQVRDARGGPLRPSTDEGQASMPNRSVIKMKRRSAKKTGT